MWMLCWWTPLCASETVARHVGPEVPRWGQLTVVHELIRRTVQVCTELSAGTLGFWKLLCLLPCSRELSRNTIDGSQEHEKAWKMHFSGYASFFKLKLNCGRCLWRWCKWSCHERVVEHTIYTSTAHALLRILESRGGCRFVLVVHPNLPQQNSGLCETADGTTEWTSLELEKILFESIFWNSWLFNEFIFLNLFFSSTYLIIRVLKVGNLI